ncbi:hypothetical protein NXY28_17850 [Bacteroides thetaiotaomicron]|nr:hypothetical protein NXY28_17850 [Bacteroides thetaiotaomicron]
MSSSSPHITRTVEVRVTDERIFPRVIRGEHVFTQRLGYGIPVLLDIDGRLSPGDENLCHETFF